MSKVQTRLHSGLFLDETATLCHWHVPAAHYLEAWSDARTVDGTVSIVQPLIQPMYGGKSAHEVIATLSERPERNGYDLVREYWMAQPRARCTCRVPGACRCRTVPEALQAPQAPAGAERSERVRAKPGGKWLHDGLQSPAHRRSAGHAQPRRRLGRRSTACRAFERTGAAGCTTAHRWHGAAPAPAALSTPHLPHPSHPAHLIVAPAFEVNFRRDPTIYDGRFANNGWLQELPKPVTKLTWDNAALIAPATAERLDLENGDIIEVTHEGRRLRIPVWINPGHAQDAITITRRLRPHARRPRRQRHRLQRLRAARQQRAVVRRRRSVRRPATTTVW